MEGEREAREEGREGLDTSNDGICVIKSLAVLVS